MAKEPNHNWKK